MSSGGRYLGWVRVRFAPAKWIAVSNACTEEDCRQEMYDYLKTMNLGKRRISCLVLPAGEHPTRPVEADPRL